jgi:hemoglobin/transferrin/lactoferrin receptor protein
MKKFYMLLMAFAATQTISAQNIDTTKKEISLSEVVISATNTPQQQKNIAQKIDVITAKTIAQNNAQNTGDLLLNTGKIFVQKSQQGGSSPVLRGFEASRVLLVIDGVRMNNAIYRSGHLQNVITTDQNSLSRVEVMYGPSSTIYGSDALGGTIHLITKQPKLLIGKENPVTGTAFYRHNTINKENTLHVNANIANKKWAWLQSFNYSKFGDMKMGGNYLSKYPDFGRRSKYITSINGVDSVVTNSDDRVQKFSGYEQWDIVEKLLFKPNDSTSHTINVQLSNTTNVPRYDRLQDVRNFGGSIGNTLRFADWFYGPQKRFLVSYNLEKKAKGFFNVYNANVSIQNIEESRQTREYRRYDRFDSRVEKVRVFGAVVNAVKKWNNQDLVVGFDMQLNDVTSRATRKNLLTGVISKLDTRYPDGETDMNSIGLYAQHTYQSKNGKWVFNDGVRLQASKLTSSVVDNSFFNLPQTTIKQNNSSITGNIGVVYNAAENTTVKVAISSGFRAPNVDDLAKIFESSTAAKQVIIPNSNVKPEYTYNVDVTLLQRIGSLANMELTGFYTMLRNAIVKAPFKLNGQDSITYNGVYSQVLANQNVNKANIYGFSASANITLTKGLTFISTLSYTKGYFITDDTKNSSVYEKQSNGTYALVSKKVSKKPLDHIPPTIGRASLHYERKKWDVEVYGLYNGWKRLEDFNADGEDNAQYATADGMPSWATINFRGNVQLAKQLQFQFAIENILDRNYRYFASGFSAPGRSFILALRSNF